MITKEDIKKTPSFNKMDKAIGVAFLNKHNVRLINHAINVIKNTSVETWEQTTNLRPVVKLIVKQLL